jgi:hypothetical protein
VNYWDCVGARVVGLYVVSGLSRTAGGGD